MNMAEMNRADRGKKGGKLLSGPERLSPYTREITSYSNEY